MNNISKNNNPLIMGVLNITPDSFYEANSSLNIDVLKKNLKKVIDSDIIDIGAESTQPKSLPLSLNEELSRLELIFDNLRIFKNKVLSIDTYKPDIAKKALKNGFSIINDIYGGNNEEMLSIASKFNAKIILMHIKGVPETMQNDIYYNDIVDDILKYFEIKIKKALEYGVKKSNIIIDPGIGFGKSFSDNYKIINNISKFKNLGFELMIGLSRKSFLSIQEDTPSDRLTGTICANTIAILNGADIIRVHDVKEHLKVRTIINKFIINN